MASPTLLYFFVIVTLVFIASADADDYDEDELESSQPQQKFDDMVPHYSHFELNPYTTEFKRKSGFKETSEHNNFQKNSGVKVVYSRVPMPVILVSSYPKPKH